ncbi:MAG: hypothetical protein ACKOAD_02350 [Gammaproteobacteria bacterium]
MKKNGWQGNPINVVKMKDGTLTSLDNTRLLAARKAGIEAKINIFSYDDPIPSKLGHQYTVSGFIPKTWGEAITTRIGTQKDKFFQGRIFSEKFTNGCIYDPKLTGIKK